MNLMELFALVLGNKGIPKMEMMPPARGMNFNTGGGHESRDQFGPMYSTDRVVGPGQVPTTNGQPILHNERGEAMYPNSLRTREVPNPLVTARQVPGSGSSVNPAYVPRDLAAAIRKAMYEQALKRYEKEKGGFE